MIAGDMVEAKTVAESDNWRRISSFVCETRRLWFEWLNRRDQRHCHNGAWFKRPKARHPLPRQRLAFSLYPSESIRPGAGCGSPARPFASPGGQSVFDSLRQPMSLSTPVLGANREHLAIVQPLQRIGQLEVLKRRAFEHHRHDQCPCSLGP